MADEKGFGSTLALVGGAVVLLVLANNAFSGDPKPAPTPSPTASPPTAASSDGPSDGLMIIRAQREVRALLKDPDSAKFGAIHVRRSPALVACGTVNSRNSFGGMTGAQRFVSGTVTALEEQMKPGEMDQLWQKVC